MTPRSFTHVDAGTPASAWRAHDSWAAGAPLSLDGVERLVAVGAHPDDESLGAGGLIALARAAGVPVEVVTATDGEGSHPDSPTTTGEQLAALRVAELRDAAAELGVGEQHLHRLGVADGEVAGSQEDLTRRLVEVVGDGRRTVLAAPWRGDGHPDHEAAGRAAAAAARRTGARLWEYPVWFWHWGDPDGRWPDLHPLRLDEAATGSKQRAIGSHRSQVAPLSDADGDGTLLGPDLLAHFAGGVEQFVVTGPADVPDDALDDLHREQADPWGVDSRWYERRKRAIVLAALPRERFRRGLEVGCSTGALALALADRTDALTAVDRSPTALAAARERLRDTAVEVRDLDVAEEWDPEWADGGLDLVVVSELGYFLSPAGLDGLVERVGSSLAADGVLVLCHWRHPVDGWVLDGHDVHAAFAGGGVPPLQATYQDRDVEVRVHAADTAWPDPTP